HLRVSNDGVFDDFRITLPQFLWRQRFKCFNVRDNQCGMMKHADQVFPSIKIYSGLAADRAIDHCEQRGWDLNMWNAALKNGGNKPGNIADDAAAQPDHERTPIESRCDHFVANFLYLRQRLGFFTCRNSDQSGRKIFRTETFAVAIAK